MCSSSAWAKQPTYDRIRRVAQGCYVCRVGGKKDVLFCPRHYFVAQRAVARRAAGTGNV